MKQLILIFSLFNIAAIAAMDRPYVQAYVEQQAKQRRAKELGNELLKLLESFLEAKKINRSISFGPEKLARAKELIVQGADLNIATEEYGVTALFLATRINYELINLLIEKGAQVNKVSKYGPILHYLCSFGIFDLNIWKLLMEYGADVNYDSYGSCIGTPLMRVAEAGQVELVRLLLRGVPLKRKTQAITELIEKPESYLSLLPADIKRQTYQYMHENKANPNIKSNGETALDYAKQALIRFKATNFPNRPYNKDLEEIISILELVTDKPQPSLLNRLFG